MMKYILALGLSLLAGTADAGFYTGNDLYAMCQNNDRAIYGYVAGWIEKSAWDTLIVDDAVKGAPGDSHAIYTQSAVKQHACYPNGINIQQARDVLCQFLEKAPESRQIDGYMLAQLAFGRAWPCSP